MSVRSQVRVVFHLERRARRTSSDTFGRFWSMMIYYSSDSALIKSSSEPQSIDCLFSFSGVYCSSSERS